MLPGPAYPFGFAQGKKRGPYVRMSALGADTGRLDSYLLDLFVRFAGILAMDYSTQPDGGPFGICMRDGGDGL
jgi:hypothetical protein